MLTDRQKMILQSIIQSYTISGLPVGSKSLTGQLPIHVSSATIRNEMAYLETRGLITKTHLSSGRIPSVKGYRYYVDHLSTEFTVSPSDLMMIRHSLNIQFDHIDEIVKKSANVLSSLTNYTALTFKPEQLGERKLSGFRLVPLDSHRVIAIIITDDGEIKNQTFQIDGAISGAQLEAVSNLINDQLVGKPLSEIIKKLNDGVESQIKHYLHSSSHFLKTFDEMLSMSMRDQLYIGGEFNLLDFVQNDDISYLKSLYSFLNHSDDVRSLIGSLAQPISVQIGGEGANELLKNYSLITGTYDLGDHGQGIIAVLGPTRMPYSKVIGLVSTFRKELADRLLGYYDQKDD